MADALDFHPEKIPIAEYPYPAGTGVRGLCVSTVIDRGGFTFLACCAAHYWAGTFSGYYATRNKGRVARRILTREAEPLGFPPPTDCGQPAPAEWHGPDVVLSCGCTVSWFDFARVPAVLHECGG